MRVVSVRRLECHENKPRFTQQSRLAAAQSGSLPAATDPLTGRENRYVTVRASLPFVSHLSPCCAFVYFHHVCAGLSGSYELQRGRCHWSRVTSLPVICATGCSITSSSAAAAAAAHFSQLCSWCPFTD